MSASFFSGAHNFSVGEMNVKNVSGDYIDHSTKNVRNTFRGGNNYYTKYDQSYHDSSNHHYGDNYTTTNHNHGPVNNIERVDNANFGTNYGHMNQYTFDGPQHNYHTDHHHNAPTHNYDTHAPGGNVVNGDFNGMQHNRQGPPRPDQYPPPPNQRPSPPGGPGVGQSARFPPPDDRQYDRGPADGQRRPPPVPVPGEFTASDPAVPQHQYREQRERQPSNGPPRPGFNPWPNQSQHQPPPNAPYPNERTATAPGRPQPYEEWKEHQSHPAAAPPAAYPPLGIQRRSPSPRAASSEARKDEQPSTQKAKQPQRDSWPGKTYLKETLKANGLSDSEESGRNVDKNSDSDSDRSDGYGAGSGRLRKEREAKKEREAMKDRKAAMGGWKGNPLLDEAGVGQSLLAPSRETLPAYVGTIPLTPTPVPEHQKRPANAPAPPPKAPLYGQQLAAPARPVSTPNLQESSSATIANPLLQEPSRVLPSHKPTSSLGGISVQANVSAPVIGLHPKPSMEGELEQEEEVTSRNLHGLFDEGPQKEKDKKKKTRNPLKKLAKGVFGHSSKRSMDVN